VVSEVRGCARNSPARLRPDPSLELTGLASGKGRLTLPAERRIFCLITSRQQSLSPNREVV
jgi:hypothetical protein